MTSQLGDQVCDPIYKLSESNKNVHSKMLFLESNSVRVETTSENFLSNSFEVLSNSDDANSSQNYSCSQLSFAEKDEGQVFTCHLLKEIQSTREKLTFEWVKSMTYVDSISGLDSSFDCSNNSSSDNVRSDSETDDSTEINRNNCTELCPEGDSDSIIFMDDSKESDLSELTFCFADAVTEENCDSGFSFSTRGSLANCIDDDFLDDSDYELVFSAPPLSANALPDWEDIISEASELSQGYENEIFVDFFDPPTKSKALRKVNERWESDMSGVDVNPREPIKVTFAPLPDLVTVHFYKKSFEENQPYDTSALDRIRFQNRVEQLSKLLSPILTLEHRTNIFIRNSLFITPD